jgi:hypothetical protein
MKPLQPLVGLLLRSLRWALLRRCVAWLACAGIVIALGGCLVQPFGEARVFRLGLLLGVLSALPAFLFWPTSERFLTERLRLLDEEMVFEAYLEAEPGPVRDLLQRSAAERALLLEAPRESLTTGLGKLLAVAVGCVVLAEAGSLFLRGRSLGLGLDPPAVQAHGGRLEDQGFSDYATEDPALRQARRERFQDQEARKPGTLLPKQGAALAQEGAAGIGEGQGVSTTGRAALKEALAKRKQGDLEGAGPAGGQEPAASRNGQNPGGSGQQPGMSGTAPDEKGIADRGGSATAPGRTNQGYEHTADTKIPSPLLDYRSRLEARYAERTGTHVSASGPMGFGELRAFQRRYFESFHLRAEVGGAEDPYVSLLKQRWSEARGGLR